MTPAESMEVGKGDLMVALFTCAPLLVEELDLGAGEPTT